MKPTRAVSAYYFFLFGGLGVFWPNYALFLQSRGLSQSESAVILAIGPAMGLVAPPIFGLLADALRARVWVLRILSAGAAVVFAGWLIADSRAIMYGTALLFGLCRAPLTSLSDASAFEAVKRTGGSYGILRLWGSLGFVLAAFGGGWVLEHLGAPSMITVAVAALLGAAGFAWAMPAPPTEAHPEVFRAWLRMLRAPELWVLLFAVAVGQIGASTYDWGFSQRLASLGYGGTFIGLAWALGVTSEIFFMWGSGRILGHLGADRLLMTSLLVAAGRWVLLTHLTTPAVILVLQPLHGITFGCFYVAWVHLARDRAPAEAPTAAQGLFGAASALGAIVGMVSAGRIFQRFGGVTMFRVAAAASAIAALATLTYSLSTRRAAAEGEPIA